MQLHAKSSEEIRAAFDQDGYNVVQEISFRENRGFLAESKSVTNYVTGKARQVLYVEGDSFSMGYLIGRLMPQQVHTMATSFVNNIIPAFIHPAADPDKSKILKEILGFIVRVYCRLIYWIPGNMRHIPWSFRREMRGMVRGCRDSKKVPRVPYGALFALNVGIDCLLSAIYSGFGLEVVLNLMNHRKINEKHFPDRPFRKKDMRDLIYDRGRPLFRIPVGCNALYLSPEATETGHAYLGRDFMFPTAGIFQDTACMTIYNPVQRGRRPRRPLVSVTAPGFVGSITALNIEGLGMGVDMVSSVLCSMLRPGLNSLLLVRRTAERAADAESAVEHIVRAPRGVTWLYPLGDKSGRAAIVEAGKKQNHPDYKSLAPEWVQELLPIDSYQPSRKGVYARWNDYVPSHRFEDINEELYRAFNLHTGKDLNYPELAFNDPEGMINPDWKTSKIPESYYFAPQREVLKQILLAGNHFLVPEMRLSGMAGWTNWVTGSHLDDFQWRYDELNRLTLQAGGYRNGNLTRKISRSKARDLIDFLSPQVSTLGYYDNNPTSPDGKEKIIEGTVSLLDLEERSLTTHYGYYCDGWLNLNLSRYI